MDTDQLVALLVEDVWNGQGDQAGSLIDPSCPGLDGTGPEAVVAWHRDRRAAFPDLRYEVVSVVASASNAAVRWRAQGHQEGQFGPVPATGRAVSYEGASFLTFRQGRLVDVWSVNDLFGLVQQLGAQVVPPT
jgi:steroid delta-isomerase-like uncharacterized protein